jgi:hypothetical protein
MTDINFVIIGDTSLATIYATKIVASYVNTTMPQIFMLTTGNDQTTDVYIDDLDYARRNTSLTLKILNTERLHLILNSSNIGSTVFNNNNFTPGTQVFENYYQYFYGAGPLGDSIAAYYQPMVGPWFTNDTQGRIHQFVSDVTQEYPLYANETIVANNLITALQLTPSTNVVAIKPTILTSNYIFVQRVSRQLDRQLFREEYVSLSHDSNVNIVTHVNNIFVQETTNGCLRTVSYSTSKEPVTVVINNACMIWATNLYSYVRILGISETPHRKIQLPVSYRIVYAMPKVNPLTGVDLTHLNANGPILGDGLTTRLTFACTNVADPGESMNSTTPTWNVTCYTTDTDYAEINPGGAFVNPCNPVTPCCTPGYTLLVVEAMSLVNRRTLSWDAIHLSVSVAMNTTNIEIGYYNEFIKIFQQIYLAYTGALPETPLTVQADCGINNICGYKFPLETTLDREGPQTLVIRMISDLFGGTSFPNANASTNTPSCCGQKFQ